MSRAKMLEESDREACAIRASGRPNSKFNLRPIPDVPRTN